MNGLTAVQKAQDIVLKTTDFSHYDIYADYVLYGHIYLHAITNETQFVL